MCSNQSKLGKTILGIHKPNAMTSDNKAKHPDLVQCLSPVAHSPFLIILFNV